MRTRSFRRFQQEKKKHWVKAEFKNHYAFGLSEVAVGVIACSPARCSCHMCGNPRRHFKNSHPYKISELRRLQPIEGEY